MRQINVKPGQRIGRVTIIQEAPQKKAHRRFDCLCDCGTRFTAHLAALRTGNTTSCGCWRKQRATIHGMHKESEYRCWAHMISRCSDRKSRSWKNYGGRGIRVCKRWVQSFAAFLEDVGRRPGPGYTLDRYPDNNGNYEPGNVRWATARQQHGNTRRTIRVDYKGQIRPMVEVARELGLNPDTVRERRRRGWADSELFR